MGFFRKNSSFEEEKDKSKLWSFTMKGVFSFPTPHSSELPSAQEFLNVKCFIKQSKEVIFVLKMWLHWILPQKYDSNRISHMWITYLSQRKSLYWENSITFLIYLKSLLSVFFFNICSFFVLTFLVFLLLCIYISSFKVN